MGERVLADYVSDGVEDIDLIAYNEHCPQHNLRNVGDDNEEDGQPVVIASHEVEASIARSSIAAKKHSQEYQHEFPLLYAAMTSGEDEVMARARILDEKNDVSLVREAASYLQNVEARREL